MEIRQVPLSTHRQHLGSAVLTPTPPLLVAADFFSSDFRKLAKLRLADTLTHQDLSQAAAVTVMVHASKELEHCLHHRISRISRRRADWSPSRTLFDISGSPSNWLASCIESNMHAT